MDLPCPQTGAPSDRSPRARVSWAAEVFCADRLGIAAHRVRFLQEERARATEALVEAEAAFLELVAEDHRSGTATWAQLDAAHQLVARSGGFSAPGSAGRWDEIVAVPRRILNTKLREEAAGANGEWSGHTPLHQGEVHPPERQHVAYILFDEANVPVYVGSTGCLRARLLNHRTPGKFHKVWSRWTAYRCDSVDEAVELENRFLRQFKPRYNIAGPRAAARPAAS